MRKFLKFFVGNYMLLLNAAYAQPISTYPAEVLNLRLDQIQFRGTHNSYWLDHSPAQLIDDYNVWELELDFGVLPGFSDLIVGHDGPEPKFGLRFLRHWVSNAKAASERHNHPIILKLEAKTQDTCPDPTCLFACCWEWADIKDWGNWQTTLTNELEAAIGPENWITRGEFENEYHSTWPSARELTGKFIVSLQDNNEGNNAGKDIQDPSSTYFFFPQFQGKGIPLTSNGPSQNASDFGRALKSNANRLTMDNGYQEPWSNVLVHSPLPSAVNSSHTGWQWGTSLEPFQTIGHAMNANWMQNGEPTTAEIQIVAGNYPEKATLSTPAIIGADNGMVTIGGANVAYTIVMQLMDVNDAGTGDPVYVQLHGSSGSTAEHLLENSNVFFKRNGAGTFWLNGPDLGTLQSITVRVGGGDDVAIDDIIVISATTGRYSVKADWIGNDHVNPRTFNF